MGESVRAWHPSVPQVREVLHATFEHHAYPVHTHDAWTVLLVDDGSVAYQLDRAPHDAAPASITLLPPGVPHDGRSASGLTYRKRVLYLEDDWLPRWARDAAVAAPTLRDPAALATLNRAHAALRSPADSLDAEVEILALRESVSAHLGSPTSTTGDVPLARRLRELLDDRVLESFTIEDAARILGAHPSHLVRTFSRAYGIAPHRYVVGLRVDRARRHLLDGLTPAEAASASGFHDQAHLTRHFRRTLGTTPAAFRSGRAQVRAQAQTG
ncbi:AraC family transcriptional regulator [Isoptericola sp. NPDC056618]|uniref:helix-turn-helix transcriptional regulator n=1 Tax=Isoptericola sp. NPDC056618 TaxID=3345878 RepID=UPI0036A8F858